MKKLLALAFSSFIAVTASASDWVYIGGNSESDAFVDVESISGGYYKTAFIEVRLKEDQVNPIQNDKFNLIVSLREYNCNDNVKKERILSMLVRYNELHVFSDNTPSEWDILYPDTVGEAIANTVCTY